MGFLKKLFGGADGVREAMRDSYAKHVRMAEEGKIPVGKETPHNCGLYGALATRYQARGIPVEKLGALGLWDSLVPFLSMEEQTAVEALAEYVVYQEMPKEARIPWLSEMINTALQHRAEEIYEVFAVLGFENRVPWCELLTPQTRCMIEEWQAAIQHAGR